MKCLILAAGYATRLYPLTENFPKPLLKVGEKSILDWLVDDLVDTTDIDEFVVISNHKFAQHFEDWKNEKVRTRPYELTVIDDGTSTNETRLGAVKDIQLAVEELNLTDDLLVMAGDNVLDFSLSKFVEFAKGKGTSCVMCHEENELKKQQKTAIITLNENDLITSYEEKPKEPKPTESPKQTFDVGEYVSYAKNYAQSIGLELDSTATECWDNPITANSRRTGIKDDIKSRLNRYKNVEGFTAVWIWAEKVSDTEYEIYIGYC